MEFTLMAIKYNNYYNRILRIGKTIHDYEAEDGNPYYEYRVYFKFGDGVNTTQVLNDNVENKDYVILIEEDGTTINSRWFIIDATYQLNGQQVVTLRRDLLADFSDTVLYSDSFIEKGYLRRGNNLLFNKEDMTFNQVKKEELLLKDSTNIPWIVGYYPNNANITGTAQLSNTEYDEVVNSNFEDWKYYEYFSPFTGIMHGLPKSTTFSTYNSGAVSAQYGSSTLKTNTYQSDFGNTVDTSYVNEIPDGIFAAISSPAYDNHGFQDKVRNVLERNYDVYKELLIAEYEWTRREDFNNVISYNNKRVKFNDGIKLLKVKRTEFNNSLTYTATYGLDLSNKFISDYGKQGITISPQAGKPWVYVSYLYDIYTCTADSTASGKYSYSIGQNHYTLSDSPYSMFCMPYGPLTVIEGENSIKTDKDIQMAVATSMAETSGNIYDIQILPYCPIGEINSTSYTVTDTRAYDVIKIGETTAGYIFHCQRSSFSKRLSLLPLPTWLTERSDPADIKVQNECEFIRFNSPNYASSWEMSVAKNEGVSWVNVAATYKPYNPYIKIYPDFKGLYGSDFNDQRGLILSGDFSIPVVTDQWKTYELNQKNYQSMFDREIKNLEVQQKYGRLQDVVGAATGAIGAAGTGAALGSAAGPLGMAIGAVAGGIMSAGAGIADVAINDQLRDEAKNYKTDMYGYQLGNIKALPNTLTKTSAYNIDNKYFPFIEHYSATNVEIWAFKDKLKYNGMTVGVIGRFIDYINNDEYAQTYVKGQLIRLRSIGDMNIANQLALEMSKGVYINGNITAGN